MPYLDHISLKFLLLKSVFRKEDFNSDEISFNSKIISKYLLKKIKEIMFYIVVNASLQVENKRILKN